MALNNSPLTEQEKLERAIAALEAQRPVLGDAVVDAALQPLRQKVEELRRTAVSTSSARKQVTVLFADVSGFTALSEKLDAEDVTTVMNALWTRLDGAITDNGGWIDKHIGDAVMALFGVPNAHEDDPEHAIRAALAMQSALADFRAEMNVPLAMRIGINTGPVFLDKVGTTAEYTAMGDAVNVASRMEHAAPVGGILICHDTYRHVRGVFDVQVLEPIHVKGKSELLQVYLVQGAKPRPFRVTTRGVEGIETHMVGRETELRQLQTAMQQVLADTKIHAVTVCGEAGIGKSRLLYEFTNWLELQPVRFWMFQARMIQGMRKQPYALLRGLFSFRFDIQENDSLVEARRKLEVGVMTFTGADDQVRAHFLGHMIGLDYAHSPYLQGILDDARQIRDRAFHYTAQLLQQMAEKRPLLMLLEDIHWADDASLDFIEYLVQTYPNSPILIASLTRPPLFERRPNWFANYEQHQVIPLQPLTESLSNELVGHILRKVSLLPRELRARIVQSAEGNPFYIEELIKMLLESGVIQKNGEEWHIASLALAELNVPPTLVGVLQARLDRLAMPIRETLQQASVIGRMFWDDAIAFLNMQLSRPTPPLNGPFHDLRQKEMIYERSPSTFRDTREYSFKSGVLRDVVYESVLKRDRRQYHLQVACWLADRSGNRAGEYAG
ncbi:MAG: AAA family ATPase, partial [Anaerolineales bacterium]|nr:AAA family ATPase [Anaerolineales bacterium]